MGMGLRAFHDGKSYELHDATGLQWSTHRSPAGGGFGYLKFKLPRKIGANYADIGYGYDVTLFKTPNDVRFYGQIRSIEEVSSLGGDQINITALGYVIVAQDDEIVRHFCDKRLNMWKPESEIPKKQFRPDLFTFGTNDLGFYVHPSNGKDITAGDYTEVVYEFSDDESAQRFKATFSLVGGSGTLFDAVVSAIDDTNGYVDYTTDSGESQLEAGMVVYNSTQAKEATISTVDTGANRITVTVPGEVSGWAASDEIAVYGPRFLSNIDSITGAVITYNEDTLIGESNITLSGMLCNINKKAVATIQSTSAVANTITVSNEDHIAGWENDDLICEMSYYFSALFSSKAGATVTYGSQIGERVASSTTGWVVYNFSRQNYATVDSWNIASDQFDVTDAGDIADWGGGDSLGIFTPFRLQILDTADNVLWPASDWRQGAVLQDRTSINVTTTGTPAGLKIRFSCYISGSASQSSFIQLMDVKAYSTTLSATATTLAKDVVTMLSATGLDLSSSISEIATVTKEIEPMIFEFATPAQAMQWACEFGDENGDGLNWGVTLDNQKKLYLEVQDRSTIVYKVVRQGPVEASVTGDVQKSVQQVRAIYSDKLGVQQITAWQTDSAAYFDGHFRRKNVKVDNVDTDAEAISAIQLYLDDNKNPEISTRYTVGYGAVLSAHGNSVQIEDIQALNGIVMIQDWRAVESGMSGTDIRDSWTKEQIVAVEIDYDARRATLTPASSRGSFESYMAELSRLAEL